LTHQNIGQARELAQAIVESGFNVDVVDYDETRRGLFDHPYDLVIDLHPVETPVYRNHLTHHAKRISYITGCDPAFANAAEHERLAAVRARRGATLAPRRQAQAFPRASFESYDAMFLFGGRFARETYANFRCPPLHALVNNGYDHVEPTDPAARRANRFMFLGGNGQVHKGLDLLLEVFASEPDLELVVCSPFAREADFAQVYRAELQLPNVQAIGFVDVLSPAFRQLQAQCAWMILPSCAEGQCGSVTVAMSFGLTPVVSEACGFEDPEIMILPDCSIDAIRRTVQELAVSSQEIVRTRSEQSFELMRRAYRPEHYAAAVRAGLAAVLAPAGGEPA